MLKIKYVLWSVGSAPERLKDSISISGSCNLLSGVRRILPRYQGTKGPVNIQAWPAMRQEPGWPRGSRGLSHGCFISKLLAIL
jgi:hypothetical protein